MSKRRRTILTVAGIVFAVGCIPAFMSLTADNGNPFAPKLFAPVSDYVHRDRIAFYESADDIHEYRQIHLTGITVQDAERLLAPHLKSAGYAETSWQGMSLKQVQFVKTDADGVRSNITVSDAGIDGLQGVLINESHVAGGYEVLVTRVKGLGKSPFISMDKTVADGSRKFLQE